MNTENDTPKSENSPQQGAGEGCSGATCSAFDEWWQVYGLRAEPQILEMAYKEIAFKGWVAAAEKCAIVCEFWGNESRSVIRSNFLPNVERRQPRN